MARRLSMAGHIWKAELKKMEDARPTDPRDPDHTRSGMFVYHNCSRCHNGERACVRGNPSGCEWPHARND